MIHGRTGVVVKSPNFPDWNDLPLKSILEAELKLPVVIENDRPSLRVTRTEYVDPPRDRRFSFASIDATSARRNVALVPRAERACRRVI